MRMGGETIMITIEVYEVIRKQMQDSTGTDLTLEEFIQYYNEVGKAQIMEEYEVALELDRQGW